MGDDLLNHWREYGSPKRSCFYTKEEDGSVHIGDPIEACCLSDFSDVDFYVKPKNPPKLSGWKKHISTPVPPPKTKN